MAFEGTITVAGNLGADAELKKTAQGTLVTSFPLANQPRIKKGDEWIDGEAIWFRCFIWGKDATGAANELRKGMRIVVTGKFSSNTWVNKDGESVKTLEVNVESYGVTPRNVAEPVSYPDTKSIEDPLDEWA